MLVANAGSMRRAVPGPIPITPFGTCSEGSVEEVYIVRSTFKSTFIGSHDSRCFGISVLVSLRSRELERLVLYFNALETSRSL